MNEVKKRSSRYEEQPYEEKEEKIIEEEEKKHPLLKRIFITIFLIIILLITYSCLIEPKLLKVNEYKVESNIIPTSFNGLKIVQFSDIHYGSTINQKELSKIVTEINNLKPDIIFFTGDLIDKSISSNETIENEIKEELSKLEATLYKYAIYGDEDQDNYKDIMESCDFQVLDNESTLLYYKDNTPILITGYNIIDTSPDYSIINNKVNEIDTTSLYKIVLTHEPNSIDNILEYNPNLILSGHTLGGLIKIPFLKPLFLNNSSYYKEHYQIDNTNIYISNGLGTSGITARFNNIPSINLYRIYKTE